MKKFVISSLLNLFSLNLVAAVITVSNNPTIPAKYSLIQTAHDNASAGDTLLIAGGYNAATATGPAYGSLTISKQIVLIGPGYNPSNNGNLVSYFNSGIVINSSAAGTIIDGLTLGSSVTINAINVTIRNSRINVVNISSTSPLNCFLTNNIIVNNGAIDLGTGQNINILGNLFYGSASIRNSNQQSVLVEQNVFITAGTSGAFAGTFTNARVRNNIFYSVNPAATNANLSNCIFDNNLTYQCTSPALPPTGATGTGNIVSQNPLFQSVTIGNNNSINYNNDYRLTAGSPGHNASTTGGDIGMYGGTFPMKDPPLSGMPPLPYVTLFDIASHVIYQGTNLNVHLKARKAN